MSNCDPRFHKTTGLTASATAVNMTVTNSTNIASLDCFKLVLCECPNSIITGAPLPYTITINGSTAQLYNKYRLPVYTNRLKPRKVYRGAYVNNGTDAWVILFDTPCDPQYATSGVTSTAAAPAVAGGGA